MKNLLLAALCATLLFSCSKEKKLARTLKGTWDVDQLILTPPSADDIGFSASNVGTIEFKKDGTGKNNWSYSYEVQGETIQVTDSESFKWENTDNTVTITGNANSGEKSIVWHVDDSSKDDQVWTRTDADGYSWEIHLHKE